MTKLFVPISIERPVFSLYEVNSEMSGITFFNGYSVPRQQKRLDALFSKESFDFLIVQNDTKIPFLDFNGNENSSTVDSISLGVLCSAYAKVHNRLLKEKYDSITVTGNYNIDEDRNIYLQEIGDIEEKFDAVQQYAKNHGNEQHLYIYVSSEDIIPDGFYGDNLLTIRYDTNFSIQCIFAEIFEGTYTEEQESELNNLQIKEIENSYIPTKGVIAWKKQFVRSDFHGLVLKGNTNTGKTIATKYFCKWLIDTNCVDDIVWITVTDNLHFYDLLKESRNKLFFKDNKKESNEIEQYFVKEYSKIRSLLQIGKRIVLVIDNIEAEFIDEIIDYLSYKYANYLYDIKILISSWYGCRKSTALHKLGLLEKSISELLPSDKEFPLLVRTIIEGTDFKTKHNELNTSQKDELIKALYPVCKKSPGLIPIALTSLTKKTIQQGLQNLKTIKNSNNDITESLFQLSLDVVDFFSQIVLFAYLGIDDFDSEINIATYKKIIKKKIFNNKIEIADSYISSSFEELVQRALLEKNGSKIAIKNDALRYFAFSQRISKELQSVRNVLIDKNILIKFAMENSLYYDFLRIVSEFKDKNQLSYALFLAARVNADIQFFKALIEKGADVNYVTKEDHSLSWFVFGYCKKIEVLQLLIESRLLYNRKSEGLSPLLSLSQNDSDEVFNYVIDNHLYDNIESEDQFGNTILLLAFAYGNTKRVQKLLSIGANLYKINKRGVTFLHAALFAADENILKFIFENNLCNNLNLKTKEKLTPLAYSAIADNLRGFKLLLQQGADLEHYVDDLIEVALRENSEKIIRYIFENNLCNISDRLEINLMYDGNKRNYLAYYVKICNIFNINIFNILWKASAKGAVKELKANTILLYSFWNENTSVPAQYLLNNHYYTDLNMKDSDILKTPLQIAVQHMPLEIIKILLQKTNNKKDSLLLDAVANKNANVIEYLFNEHLIQDFEEKDEEGYTALLLSALLGNIETYKKLISYGANPYAVNYSGYSSFILAAGTNARLLKYILDNKLFKDINEKTNKGTTALLQACYKGLFSSFLILLQYGADPEVITSKGNNLLHVAVLIRNKKMIKYILKNLKMINPELRNNDGKRPIDLAKSQEIKKLFLE